MGNRADLLVSVQNATEARTVLDHGVRWLDVKDPSAGSLGRPDIACVDSVLAAVASRRCKLSIAWGELTQPWTELPGRWRGGVGWIKLGLAGAAHQPRWQAVWQRRVHQVRQVGEPVAVVYADGLVVGSPHPVEIVELAARAGCATLLVDTCDKAAGSLVHWWDHLPAPRLLQSARRHRMRIVLAGSITCAQLPQVLAWRPDLVAMRSGLCQDHRAGQLDPDKLRMALHLVRSQPLPLAETEGDQHACLSNGSSSRPGER